MSRLSHDRVCPAAAIVALALAAACSDSAPTATRTPPSKSNEAASLAVSTEAAGTPKSGVPTGEGLGLYPGLSPSPTRTRYRPEYHTNGYVMTGTPNVYFIWYGTWKRADGSDDPMVYDLAFLTATLGNSAYFRVNRLYTDVNGQAPSGGMVYSGETWDATYSHGAVLSKGDVGDVVSTQILNGGLPLDIRGIYVVVTSPDVYVDGFAQRFCAYHDVVTIVGATVPLVLIGSPARAPTVCQPQSIGPNGNAASDAAASLLAAELSNVQTDFWFNAWYDRLGLEPADKCAWTYGTTYKAANGALANIMVGGRDYLLQQLWVPTKNGGTCAMRIPGT